MEKAPPVSPLEITVVKGLPLLLAWAAIQHQVQLVGLILVVVFQPALRAVETKVLLYS